MKKTIFDFQDYKKYLLHVSNQGDSKTHGFGMRLAKAAGCQRAFVSLVLKRDAHFSVEHLERICRFLKLNRDETRYMIFLLLYARAGNAQVKEHFRREMKGIIHKSLSLKGKIPANRELSHEDQSRYYSSWEFAAIHVAPAVPGLQSREAIAKKFSLPLKRVSEVVDFLIEIGVLAEDRGVLSVRVFQLYIANDSSLMTAKSHVNWRIKAITALTNEGMRDMHFSYVGALSHEAALELKAFLVKCAEESHKKISASSSEALYALNFDFFEV